MAVEDIMEKCCSELLSGNELKVFQRFLCPIAIVEADVEEYIVDEYDSVELLVLRLYSAGIQNPKWINQLTGIDVNMIQKLIDAEKYIYGHIDPHTNKISDMGKKTLEQNTDVENLFCHALFHVKRELQVDALTGTLIHAEAERLKFNMQLFNNMRDSDADLPNVLPNDSVVLDEELTREIHQRLQYYIDEEYFLEGNTINEIKSLRTEEIRYRDAYYVWVRNFDYPFVALKYKQNKAGKGNEVVMPIAISESDAKSIGIEQTGDKYLVRKDSNFRYLRSLYNNFCV